MTYSQNPHISHIEQRLFQNRSEQEAIIACLISGNRLEAEGRLFSLVRQDMNFVSSSLKREYSKHCSRYISALEYMSIEDLIAFTRKRTKAIIGSGVRAFMKK